MTRAYLCPSCGVSTDGHVCRRCTARAEAEALVVGLVLFGAGLCVGVAVGWAVRGWAMGGL